MVSHYEVLSFSFETLDLFISLREVMDAGGKAMYEQDAAKKEQALTQLKTELTPRIFGYLEKRAKDNGGKSLAGGEGITYADLALANLLNTILNSPMFGEPEKLSAAFPTLVSIAKSINESEPIKVCSKTNSSYGFIT